ncbi:FIST signal transduction protein [Candidatus Magnetaquicoccus inordinatus]|uniref:FIST signal transduction protein n=1 Tax=Candidatus Magnetaquicoccus inordinatus TaxID=2496818 RepID=UPI00102B31C1|nr:FIST N-terminal domain-containing protein [Candidatus Magnetaquicoccus inordinatus]
MKIAQKIFTDGLLHVEDLQELQALDPQLLLVFGPTALFASAGFYESVRAAFPQAQLAGCTTAGEIAGEQCYDGACVLTAVHFADTGLRLASAAISAMEESSAVGEEVGRQLLGEGLRGVLVFSKGLGINGSALIRGMVAVLGKEVPINGGLAGDGARFQQTMVLDNQGVSSDRVVAIGLYGQRIRIGYGSVGGWEPFGPIRRITRCEGNVLFELDGEPALNLYQDYLGEYAQDLPASGLLFPFEMLSENKDRLGLIRTILAIDEAQGSLVLAGEIDPNGYLRLMHASTNALVDGAELAAQRTRQLAGNQGAGLALLVSCVGRKLVMGDHVDEEVEVVADTLATGSVLTGFHSYGEISPLFDTVECKLHNQTMTITFLAEE